MSDDPTEMFAPPINRAMKVLDRSFFQKTINTSAARIFSPKDISRVRTDLDRSRDSLKTRLDGIRPDTDAARATRGGKCLILKPDVVHNDTNTWSPKLRQLEEAGTIGVIPYELKLDYDFFTYSEITNAIIPPPEKKNDDEIPTGFTLAGHVAHLNLRERYLPYKNLIATVLADKNPIVTTVINKLDNVGTESAYRTFQYEVLVGDDDLNVEVHEQGCQFHFDFAKVYWNTRLHTEHERLCGLFREGEAICDVMAGVGPFAVPAAKKKCFVWANDLNPDSYKYLAENIKTNKVDAYVRAFNTDGAAFIRSSAAALLKDDRSIPIFPKKIFSRSAPKPAGSPQPLRTLVQPRIFSHYVMNLPASAITFLPAFIGLYSHVPGISASEIRKLLSPHTDVKLPMIHVHCFSTKSKDDVAETKSICEEISRQLNFEITPETPELEVFHVRDVAPKKTMFCASFRLPEDVAFREV
ncbi:tRNA(m(1)G37)methyltransferase [Paraphaeosphaeria minitans]|uniref:tRNA (guanine(37)-N1)-methyltransferase n=1 Tax=Paraphaeosphaeria minitans TaxID=565426 RepID=A0A9P6GIU5_9PLEO|nr:tRNA (guanine(37)-N1)-methyltransferase [Paraphaeosphaeria minitans]